MSSYSSQPCTPAKACTHRHSDEQTGPLDLPHIGDTAGLVRLELANDLPFRPNDADPAFVRARKETIRAGAHAGGVVALEELARFVIEGDLGDVEEVE